MVSLDMVSRSVAVAVGAFLLAVSQPALAEKKYGPGVTDTSIKFGQTMPYSGGASGLSAVGRVQTAYFKMINAQGGINGRAINLISKDDGFSPPKTVEQTRSLVEGDEVLAMFSSMGSAPNLSVAKYLNSAQVPQIMALAGTPKAIDPVNFPWTTTFYSTLTVEAKVLAAYLLEVKPNAKIGILYQNDESGRTYLEGMRAGLGDKAGTMIVKEVGFDLSYPTIDSQIILLQSSGADTVFVASAAPKFGAQSIRKIGELGWKPYLILAPGASVIETSLKPAGLQYVVGAVSVQFYKQPGDSKWDADPGMMEYYTFMKKWAPAEVPEDALAVIGYSAAQMLIDTLKRCGDNLTRENLIYEATHIKDYEPTLFLPGIKVNVTPESRLPWRQRQIIQFDGTNWTFVGGLVTEAGER